MPVTAVGKIFRPALRKAITAKVLSEHLLNEGIAATVTTEIDARKGMLAAITLADNSQQDDAETILSAYNVTITFV